MHYEFVGSVGVFAIYALVPNRLLRIGVLLIAGVLLWQEYYFCFVVGVVLYEWMKEPLYLGDRLPSWPAWIFLVAGLYMGAFPYNVATPDNPWFGRMLFLDVEQWHRLGSVPFLFGVISLDPVRRFLMLRPFQYLGKISFALYLVHVPLIGSFMSLAIIHLYWPPHSTFAIGVAAACTMPMSVLCAHFIQRFIDGPAIRLSHLAGRWISEAFTAPLPSTMHAGVAPQSSELRQWSV